MRRVALVIAAIGLVCGAGARRDSAGPAARAPVPTPGARRDPAGPQPAALAADPATAPAAPAAPAPPAAPAGPSLEQLTAQAADLDRAIRKAVSIAERKRLTEELEKLKHQMGPYDANGQRVRCLAMWHDSAVESLEIDVKRLSSRPSSLGGGPAASGGRPAVGLRLATRRMALACLSHGWRMPAGAVKYQVDAFGEYLANNTRLLDPFFDAVGAWAGKDVKAADAGEDAAVLQNAAESVRQGIDRMGRAAETMGETASDQEAALVPLLGEYLAGLRAVCDAHDAVREALRGKGRVLPGDPSAHAAGAPPAAAGEAAAPEDEPPPMTTEEQDRLAKVRAAAAKLTGAGWAPVVQSLERFAAVVEAGFQVVSARTKARELLASLARAAALAEKTVTSPNIPAAYVKVRQMTLALALSQIQDPETRARGYVHVEACWQEDQLWRQLEALRLAPQACQGLMHGYYVTWYELRTQGTPEAIDQARVIRDAYRGLGPALQKMAPGQSKDLAPKLKECYDRQEAVIRGTLEAAGAAFATDSAAAVARLNQVGSQVGDLDLIVRADAVVKTVARYRPARSPQMLTQVVRAAADLTAPGAVPDAPRALLDSLVRPFEALSRFPLPEPDLMRAVQTLVGRAYGGATAALTQTVGAGIDAVSAGDPVPLRQALDAEHLFGLLRRRAIAGTYHLDKAAVANLTAFSMPEKPWAAFVDAVDAQLRATFAAYAVQGPNRPPVSLAAPAEWDAVYAPVAAAQRLTVDARHPGETDLDLLMRNLEQTAVSPEAAHGWWNWAVAYHATEAAVTANAGLDTVAAWHRTTIRSYDRLLLSVDLLPPKGR